MFDLEQKNIEEKIIEICNGNGVSINELKWRPIPFLGEWGISTSFFQIAADEIRRRKVDGLSVLFHAQEIASNIRDQLGVIDGINRIEAVKGYLNFYFITSE